MSESHCNQKLIQAVVEAFWYNAYHWNAGPCVEHPDGNFNCVFFFLNIFVVSWYRKHPLLLQY